MAGQRRKSQRVSCTGYASRCWKGRTRSVPVCDAPCTWAPCLVDPGEGSGGRCLALVPSRGTGTPGVLFRVLHAAASCGEQGFRLLQTSLAQSKKPAGYWIWEQERGGTLCRPRPLRARGAQTGVCILGVPGTARLRPGLGGWGSPT